MLAPISSRMRLGISDLSYLLNVPLQPNIYDGTSGLGGSAELQGLPKPVCLGYVYNIAPVYLGTVNLGDGSLDTYQVHWRTVSSIDAVRDQGVSLTNSGAVAPIAVPGMGDRRRLSARRGACRCRDLRRPRG